MEWANGSFPPPLNSTALSTGQAVERLVSGRAVDRGVVERVKIPGGWFNQSELDVPPNVVYLW
jgi:hypothetical protein